MTASAPWRGGSKLSRGSAVAGCAGLVAWIAGLLVDSRQALFSLLIAYAYMTSLLVGSLILLMAIHAARSEWPIGLRRIIESVTATLPLLVIFFIPIAIGLHRVYVWDGAEPADLPMHEAIEQKGAYLTGPFFLVRSFVYLATWIVPAFLLRRWSLRQDADGDPRWNHKQWALSGIGLVVLSLTLTFAAFDWFMSLTPDWKSSIYGVYFFAGGFVSAFALLIVLMSSATGAGLLTDVIKPAHYLSTGKYIFAFTIFWGYTAYAQFFIIWIANIPAESSWWVPRIHGWGGISIALAFAQFAIPFCALLSRRLKFRPRAMTVLACWVLVAHYLDMYWLVDPALHKQGPSFSWMNVPALVMVLGFAVALAAWRARGYPLVPAADPRFRASLVYEGS